MGKYLTNLSINNIPKNMTVSWPITSTNISIDPCLGKPEVDQLAAEHPPPPGDKNNICEMHENHESTCGSVQIIVGAFRSKTVKIFKIY